METSTHDLRSILTSEGRDFLIRNNGDQVKVEEVLKKDKVGLYFSAHWCGPCRRFTPKLADCYREVKSRGEDLLEVVFVSGDEGEDDFREYFSEMPWLAVPFEDAATRDRLNELFGVNGIPHLVVLDGATGTVVTESGVEIVREHGVDGYPFTDERVKDLQAAEEAARLNQTIGSVLSSPTRDYVVTNSGDKVPVTAELEGKIVGIYFSGSLYSRCTQFTSILSKIYSELKEKGEPFEVVLASLDDDEKAFDESFQGMPWLALPFKDKKIEKLIHYFDLSTLPTLVIIGSDGKTLNPNVAEIVDEHGIKAYPFSSKRLEELAEIEKAKLESQTLESLLVTDDIDFVLGKNDTKVPVKELVGKTVLIYFSAHWCPPCRGFTPKLAEAYNKIKEKHPQFEVIFVSSDRDQNSFDEYYAEMPWLAIPFGDVRKKSLSRTFKVSGIPTLVAIGPSGKTVNTDARGLVVGHGPDAYPFTEERLKELEEVIEAMVKKLPDTVKHELHEHELEKKRRSVYVCDRCSQEGRNWSFFCEACDFDLHPQCAFDVEKEEDAKAEGGHEGKEGYICEGDVCRKA